MARLSYVELPVGDTGANAAFYERAFGWTMTSFGPTYAATTTGDTDIGLQGDAGEATHAPLPVIEVDDVEAALAQVKAAGGGDAPDLRLPRRAALPLSRSGGKRARGDAARSALIGTRASRIAPRRLAA